MNGSLVGLAFGLGVLLIVVSRLEPRPRRTFEPGRRERLAELLAQAGYSAITPARFVGVSAACCGVALVLAAGLSRSAVIAVAFAGFAAHAPLSLVRMRRRRRISELRHLWPDVIDNLGSAIRAGLALPEAVSQLAHRGPAALQPAFARFGEDYRATGRFSECLDRLKATLADPVADRVVESLRLARDVGGSDLGRLLRTLSQFVRDDARTRAELETRQGWTVNAARLAVGAPWVLLAVMALRPEAVAAYDTPLGAVVLVAGAALSVVAYRLMLRIGRLPVERRVLR